MKLLPLSQAEAYHGFTHCALFTHADLTETTANTAQAISFAVPAGTLVQPDLVFVLDQAFRNSADNALNTTALTVGDNAAANTWLTTTELNANGSFITSKAGTATAGKAYPAADTLKFTFGSMTGKNLADLNEGQLRVFLTIVPLNKLSPSS